MFAASPEHQSAYSRLRNSKTVILPDNRLRCIRRWNRHHQINSRSYSWPPGSGLEVAQDRTSPDRGGFVALCCRADASRAPEGEANGEQTIASRAAMEAYLKQSGAQLWIEHDPETFHRLKKAPDYIE